MSAQPTPLTPQQNQQYETLYLNQLEAAVQKEFQQIQTYVNQHSPNLGPAEIIAVLNNLHAWEQYFFQYDAWARYLSSVGLSRLSQRLVQVRSDLQGSIQVFSQMYQSAVRTQADIARIQMEGNNYVTQSLMEMNARTRAVYDRMNELNRLVNEGVPFAQAEILSRMPR